MEKERIVDAARTMMLILGVLIICGIMGSKISQEEGNDYIEESILEEDVVNIEPIDEVHPEEEDEYITLKDVEFPVVEELFSTAGVNTVDEFISAINNNLAPGTKIPEGNTEEYSVEFGGYYIEFGGQDEFSLSIETRDDGTMEEAMIRMIYSEEMDNHQEITDILFGASIAVDKGLDLELLQESYIEMTESARVSQKIDIGFMTFLSGDNFFVETQKVCTEYGYTMYVRFVKQ